MRLTHTRSRLDRAEVLSTALAVAVSTALYVRDPRDYLPRGGVGDLAGLGALAAVLVAGRRRARHEAAVCLACIGLVLVLRPAWPLRYRPAAWSGTVAVGLSGYLLLRRRILAR